MGSCVSVQKKASAVKVGVLSFRSSNSEKVVIPSSEVKTDVKSSAADDDDGDRLIKAQPFVPTINRDFGSREEMFFDSQAWLDSDCDDDFMSVNGDFTPSRGNTPVHHNFSIGKLQVNKPVLEEKLPSFNSDTSPTEKKKRLSDLFTQNRSEDYSSTYPELSPSPSDDIKPKTTISGTLPTSARSTPAYISGTNSMCSSERTTNGDSTLEKKLSKSAHRCLPSLCSFRSLNDKKKTMSPGVAVNAK